MIKLGDKRGGRYLGDIGPWYEDYVSRLELKKAEDPERFKKCEELAKCTTYSIEDWLSVNDEHLNRNHKYFCGSNE